MEKSKTIIFADYENLYMMGIKEYQLKFTNLGLKRLFSYLQEQYTFEDEYVHICCHFPDYGSLLNDVKRMSYNTIEAHYKGDSVADGYLITHATQLLLENIDKIENVILIGGDKIYTGLVDKIALEFKKNVIVLGWEKGTAGVLGEINEKRVKVQYLDQIFNIKTEQALTEGWFESYICTREEFSIISFILNGRKKDFQYMLVTLANLITDSKDPRVASLNDFFKTKKFIMDRTTKEEFLKIERKPGNKGDLVYFVELNLEHPKVKHVMHVIGKVLSPTI